MHKPAFTFMSNVDLTDYVTEWRYQHGAAVFTNRQWFSLIKGRGRIILENGDGYWTTARLENLADISVSVDGMVVAVCKIEDFEEQVEQRTVVLQLVSTNDYDGQVGFETDGTTGAANEDDILAQVGLNVEAVPEYEGWTVDLGVDYCGGAFKFLRQFATHANGIMFEKGTGDYGIYLPMNDTRTAEFNLDLSKHGVEMRGLSSRRRLGWRRNAQLVATSDYKLNSVGHKDFGNASWNTINGSSSAVSRMEAIRINNTSVRIEFDFGRPPDDSPTDSRNFPPNRVEPNVYIADFWNSAGTGSPRIRDSSGNESEYTWDGEIYEAPNTDERCAITVRKTNGGSISDNDIANLQFRGLARISMYLRLEGVWESSSQTMSVGSADAFLPRTPFAIGNTNEESKITAKLNYWDDADILVTRMMFMPQQDTQAYWNDLLNLELGDVAGLLVSIPSLTLRHIGVPLNRRWHYTNNLSQLEMHFVSFRNLPSNFRLHFENNPLFFENNPLYAGV